MSRLDFTTLGSILLIAGLSSCSPAGETELPSAPPPGRLIGLEYVGSHQLELPREIPVGVKRLILSDGRVVVQSPRDWSLLVFSDTGMLLERISPPEGTYDGHGSPPGRSIVHGGESDFLAVISSYGKWLDRGVVSHAHFSPVSSRGVLEVGFEKLIKQPEGDRWWGVSPEDGVYLLDEEFLPNGPERCRPDQWPGQWVRVEGLDVDGSGSVAVLQRVHWDIRGNGVPECDYTALHILGPRGELKFQTDLASSCTGIDKIWFDGRNVLLSTYSRGYCTVDTVSRRFLHLKLPETDPPATRFSMSFVRAGTELWSASVEGGGVTVLRFRPVYATVADDDLGTVMPERNRSGIEEYRRRRDSRPRGRSGP